VGTGIIIEDDDPLIGKVLDGRYRIEEVRGIGGMGTVYRAHEGPMERDVAVKILHPQLRTSREQVGRFEREIKATARLRHPNTISVYGAGKTEDGRLYYVMQLLEEGQTLRDILENEGCLSPDRVLRVLSQVAASLGEAHRAGIVHRDLKPDNIMLTSALGQADFVTVLDFGLAKLLNPEDGQKITADGALFGTPAYMAPEQGAGTAGTAASDVYGIGCIAYELLTGRPPYSAPTPFAVLMKHMNEPPPTWTPDQKASISGALRDLVDQMLSKDPEDRPTDGATVHNLMDAIASHSNPSIRLHGGDSQNVLRQESAPIARPAPPAAEPPSRPPKASLEPRRSPRKPPPIRARSPFAPGSERSSDTINIPPMFNRKEDAGKLVIANNTHEFAVTCGKVGMRRIEVVLDDLGVVLSGVVKVRVGAPMSPVDEDVVWVDGVVDTIEPATDTRGARVQVKLASASVSPRYRHMVQYWSRRR